MYWFLCFVLDRFFLTTCINFHFLAFGPLLNIYLIGFITITTFWQDHNKIYPNGNQKNSANERNEDGLVPYVLMKIGIPLFYWVLARAVILQNKVFGCFSMSSLWVIIFIYRLTSMEHFKAQIFTLGCTCFMLHI